MQLTISITLTGGVIDLDENSDAIDIDLESIQDDDDKIEAATQVATNALEGEVDAVRDLVAILLDNNLEGVEIDDVHLEDITFDQDEEIKFEGDD